MLSFEQFYHFLIFQQFSLRKIAQELHKFAVLINGVGMRVSDSTVAYKCLKSWR